MDQFNHFIYGLVFLIGGLLMTHVYSVAKIIDFYWNHPIQQMLSYIKVAEASLSWNCYVQISQPFKNCDQRMLSGSESLWLIHLRLCNWFRLGEVHIHLHYTIH